MVCAKCRQRAKDAGVDNLPISQAQLEIQRDLQKSKVPQLEKENRKLKAKNDRLKKDLEIVDCFIKMYERGEDFTTMAAKITELEKTLEKET